MIINAYFKKNSFKNECFDIEKDRKRFQDEK